MKMSLSGKLIAGFLAVAVITLVVGVAGWYGIDSAARQIKVLGDGSIPAILNLEITKIDQLQIKVILRTLTSPYITEETYKTQLEKLEAARKSYTSALANYEKIVHTPEEERLYKAFLSAMEDSKSDNNKYLSLYAQMRESKVKADEISKIMTEMSNSGETLQAFDKMQSTMQDLLDYVKQYYGKELVEKSIAQSSFLNMLMIVFVSSGVLAALLLGIFLSRSISRPVRKVTNELRDASKALESASLQVSSSSQELSSNSSELASSIEEMTSSLEELQSIIESNTKNVNQSEHLMQETSSESQKVTVRMDELKNQLADISGNSKKISKIIKVIDDIAFQTNILALNAAVEAARAGDAGKGFAVVADQVKSLAQKSAEAAKETSELIEIAIDSVSKGESLGQVVVEAQEVAVDKASKVAVLLDEVNRASKEQLKGVNQINQAVSQINAVVQTTAASSEENAAAGEELLTQAESLGNNVGQLDEIITGTKQSRAKTTDTLRTAKTASGETHSGLLPHLAPHPSATPKKTGPELTKADDVIPMNDFKDF